MRKFQVNQLKLNKEYEEKIEHLYTKLKKYQNEVKKYKNGDNSSENDTKKKSNNDSESKKIDNDSKKKIENESELNLAYILFGIDDNIMPVNNKRVSQEVMDKLVFLIRVSNINIFKIPDPIIIEVIGRNISLVYDNPLFNISDDFIYKYYNYILPYYENISHNYKITSNDMLNIKKRNEILTLRYQLNEEIAYI